MGRWLLLFPAGLGVLMLIAPSNVIHVFSGKAFLPVVSPKESVVVTGAVLSAAITTTRPTAIFFDLYNPGPVDARLIAVSAPACGRTELHDHIKDGEVMRMRAVPAISVPAGQTVSLKPMGLHVMCFDPVLPQKIGDAFPLMLTFDTGSTITVTGQIIDFKQAARIGHPN